MPSVSDTPRVPSYRRHRPSGQGVVTLSDRDFYLGSLSRQMEHQGKPG